MTQKPRSAHELPAAGSGYPDSREETGDDARRVLDALDPKFRAVLVLRDIHGLSSREIAPILGVTHVTARWRLHRGRQLFRDAWARLDEPSSGAAEADKGVS